MAKFTALQKILIEAGYSVPRSQHFCRVLDRLRLCGQGSDDIASALLRWRMEAVVRAADLSAGFAQRKTGLPDIFPATTLFD